jgi:hypothetical protein
MNRTRFHEILHGNQEPTSKIVTNQNIVFCIKQLETNEKPLSLANGTFGLANCTFGLANGTFYEEKDKVDILYDVSYNYFHLSSYPLPEEKDENIHLSEIYVGDYQEKDIYTIEEFNPLRG